jgi:uncharacterized protein YigE (DUF2233 family)
MKLFFLVCLLAVSDCKNENIISYIINPKSQKLIFFSKNEKGTYFRNIGELKKTLDSLNLELVFAMNGGIFNNDLSPKGLYIEKFKIISPIDTLKKGYGNFYLYPNGIFYITKKQQSYVCKTEDFKTNSDIEYATQSGPLLLINGEINPNFSKDSRNFNIRNGVGILPDGKILFAISMKEVSFFYFASYFKAKGCKYALYLDGFVSKIYLPQKNLEQLDGNIGIIIGELKSLRSPEAPCSP